MSLIYDRLFPAMWLCWIAYWWAASRGAKPTERREPMSSRLLHIVPLLLAVALLWLDRVPGAWLNVRLYPWAPWVFWVAALITAAGLLFTAWARVHLGRNWSGTVTLKRGHELVTDGPYALVRHPIYTGLLAALIGSALARGEWRGVLAVLIAWAALWRKLRLEERWMAERFGEQYTAYRRHVPALVPSWKQK
ncbi:MAG TPA: isoprenylcysteine carboxylmethyltransferase family protein [Burkholderiaceae bacterium]|nr:isoprenylcysteine carboxylmethyltransferase family protein [Burkholderiaceae bacterium]